MTRRQKVNIAEKTPIPHDLKSPAQLSWRHMFQKVVALWHALSSAEKQEWESSARPHHMTGYAWFLSQALRPNPGIYLPLQGGTMAGDIDMDDNRIESLPDPVAPQDADTEAARDAAIAVHAGSFELHNRIIRKAIDEIVNNSDVLQDDDELFFSVLANEVWHFILSIRVNSAADADFDYKMAIPAGATCERNDYMRKVPSTADATAETTMPCNGTDQIAIQSNNLYVGGGNPGDVQLQWAQNTARVSDTKCLKNSFILAHQLA